MKILQPKGNQFKLEPMPLSKKDVEFKKVIEHFNKLIALSFCIPDKIPDISNLSESEIKEIMELL